MTAYYHDDSRDGLARGSIAFEVIPGYPQTLWHVVCFLRCSLLTVSCHLGIIICHYSAVFQMALSQKYDKYVLDGVSSLYLK